MAVRNYSITKVICIMTHTHKHAHKVTMMPDADLDALKRSTSSGVQLLWLYCMAQKKLLDVSAQSHLTTCLITSRLVWLHRTKFMAVLFVFLSLLSSWSISNKLTVKSVLSVFYPPFFFSIQIEVSNWFICKRMFDMEYDSIRGFSSRQTKKAKKKHRRKIHFSRWKNIRRASFMKSVVLWKAFSESSSPCWITNCTADNWLLPLNSQRKKMLTTLSFYH